MKKNCYKGHSFFNPINYLLLNTCYMRIFTFLIITLFLTNFVSAQEKGHVSGKIIDKTNAEELIGVSVLVEGSQIGRDRN